MTSEQAKETRESLKDMLLLKGMLLLSVKVNTKEDAEQIMMWMYANDKPMSSELLEIVWDKALINKTEAVILEQLRELLLNR